MKEPDAITAQEPAKVPSGGMVSDAGYPFHKERRDAALHRKQILDAARDLFDANGIESVSMHQIAQLARVGQGTLYRRYAHKGELCMDLLRESGQRFWQEIEACRTAESCSALNKLDRVISHLVHFMDEKVSLLGAICDASFGERRALQFNTPFYRYMHEVLSELFSQAIEQKELQPLDTTYTADALLAALSPDLYLFQRHERGYSTDQILAGVRRLYAH